MNGRTAYLSVASLSVSALMMLIFAKQIPYAMYVAVLLVLLSAIVAKACNVNYDLIIEKKSESRVIGGFLIIGGVLLLGMQNQALNYVKELSIIVIFVGSMLYGATLKNGAANKTKL